MYRVQTPGRYLIKGEDRIAIGDQPLRGEAIDGAYSPVYRVVVTNMESGEVKSYFPGEKIAIGETLEFGSMTIKELKAYAEKNGIDLDGASKKADILERINGNS